MSANECIEYIDNYKYTDNHQDSMISKINDYFTKFIHDDLTRNKLLTFLSNNLTGKYDGKINII